LMLPGVVVRIGPGKSPLALPPLRPVGRVERLRTAVGVARLVLGSLPRLDHLAAGIGHLAFALARHLVGMEKLLFDMAAGAEYVGPLFAACTDFQIEVGRRLVALGVDAVWVGDDFGSQTGLIISPVMFDSLLAPHYARLIQALKDVNPDVIPMLHSDGAVSKLLNRICDIGFEVFNPVQPGVPGHGPQEMKDGFGERLSFWGAVDQQELLPRGTDEQLEADVREKIRVLGRDRGYMIAPAHIIQPDVSPQRVEKFIELCKKHGAYTTSG